MRKYAPLLVAAGLVLAGAGCMGSTSTEVTVPAPAPAPQPAPAVQGKAVYTITDAATATADLKGVTAVKVTVSKLEVHSAANGWATVSTAAKTYDLLQLKATGASSLLADANLDAGTYDMARLYISDVEVTANGKTTAAKLPSNTLTLVGKLTVTAGQTSTSSFDFQVDKSLHLTGDGKYILAPVVKVLVKNAASVKIEADDTVKVDGGETETDESEGMDEHGDMKANFELNQKLELDAQGMVKIGM